MSHTFRQVDRETLFLLPPSLDEWLPEGHLARFIVEITAQLDPLSQWFLNLLPNTFPLSFYVFISPTPLSHSV